MAKTPRFVPLSFGVFLAGEDVFGRRSGLPEIAELMKTVPRAMATGWLTSLCNGYAPGNTDGILQVDEAARQLLLTTTLRRKVEQISRLAGGRIVFHRPQLLLGLQLAQRLCSEEPEPPSQEERKKILSRLGEALIRVSDVLNLQTTISEADLHDAAALFLPFYVESNPPGTLLSMRRTYDMLTDDVWESDPRLTSATERFRSSFGLSPREYMLVVLGLATKASGRRTLGADNSLRLGPVFQRGRDGASIRRAVEGLSTSYQDLPRAVLDPEQVLQKRPSEPFRSKPLIAMGDDRFWVADRPFLIDKMLGGVFWALMDESEGSERLDLLQAWGDLFERYITRRLAPAFKGRYFADPRDGAGNQLTDAAVSEKPALVLLECKAALVTDPAKYGLKFIPLMDELVAKFLKDGQLARAAIRILSDRRDLLPKGRVHPTFYPVIISLDPAVASPFIPNAMDEALRRWPLPSPTEAEFARLTVITADDAELLIRFVQAGKKLKNMIREHHEADPGGGSTFHNYLVGLGRAMDVSLPAGSPDEFRAPVNAAIGFWRAQAEEDLFVTI